MAGCKIDYDGDGIWATRRNSKKRVIVYPAMWTEPKDIHIVYVSDAYIKYAKPYAVQKILDEV